MKILFTLIVLIPLLDGLYTTDHFWYAQRHDVRQPKVVFMEEVAEMNSEAVRPLERTEPIHITCGIEQDIDCTSRGGGR